MHRDIPPISVALPVYRATRGLEAAYSCVARQDAGELEVLLVLNGSDDETTHRAEALARGDPRVRLLKLPQANLATALNVAFRESRHELVARMDADDACDSSRFRLQARAMETDASLAGIGCAYRVVTPSGKSPFTVRPPTDPTELRWRMLLGNMLAHGSMMLRRDAVLRVGGYDESLVRAQDFDLWLRMLRTERLAALPSVLYDYHAASDDGADRSSAEQAATAARCMLREWRLLAERDGSKELKHIMAFAMCREANPGDVRARLASHLNTHGPTKESLLAWTWSASLVPTVPLQSQRAARRALVREFMRSLREEGATRVWLYPAGSFTRSLLENHDDFGMPIAGIVDDHPSECSPCDWPISSLSTVPAGEHLLIASDWHEDALWLSCAATRERGVRVHRLHSFDPSREDHRAIERVSHRDASIASFVHPDAHRSKVA